jgi:PAS domain S-box-containing protein
MRGDAIVEQPDLVEAFVQQASIALQRVQAVNAHEKARTRLHKNEQQLNAFFAQSLDGFFFMMLDEPVRWDDTTDKEATLDYVFTHLQVTRINDAMLNQYGATEADFIGYTPVDFFQHDMQHGRDVFRQFYDAGKIHIKTDERRLDGSPLIVEGYYVCLYDENGRITGHFGVQRDITDQEKMKRDLLASEARANAMLDAVPDMVFRINKAGMYLDYRGAEADLYTRSRQEVIGKHFDEVPLPAPVREKVWQCIQQAFDTGEIQTCEYDLAVPGAPEETFEARIVRSGDDEVMAFVRNISDRKQAEQRELQAALNNERLHLLTDFIQNAAHEFRTPLSIMRTSTYLLERQLSPNKQNKYVTRLDRQVNRVTRLVDMLLMMVRITNQDDWLSVSVRIDELIEQVCDDALAHTNTQVTIDRTQAQQPLLVPGHADWLKKALRQPVDNALRFTPPDGVITLATHSDDTHVIVNIHNTGSIIPEAALPHIFDVFWRDDNAHSTPGFGLGLPITQRIIEAHNGTITVHSDPTTGTTFSITLPVIQKARTM